MMDRAPRKDKDLKYSCHSEVYHLLRVRRGCVAHWCLLDDKSIVIQSVQYLSRHVGFLGREEKPGFDYCNGDPGLRVVPAYLTS